MQTDDKWWRTLGDFYFYLSIYLFIYILYLYSIEEGEDITQEDGSMPLPVKYLNRKDMELGGLWRSTWMCDYCVLDC